MIDSLKSLWRGKVQILHIGCVLASDSIRIGILQLEVLVDSNVVGYVDCCEFVAIGCRTQNGSIGVVELVDRDVLVAGYSSENLFLGGSVGSIGKHSHKICDAER